MGETFVELDATGVETGASGKIFAVSAETDTDSAALHYIDQSTTKVGSTTGVTVRTSTGSAFAAMKTSETPIRDCLFVRVLEGIFYYSKEFIKVDSQLLVYSKFTTDFNEFLAVIENAF